MDASPSLTSEKRTVAMEVTSSAHHLLRPKTESDSEEEQPKPTRNRVRLHSHNSKVSKVSRTREVEVLSEKCNDDKLEQIMQDVSIGAKFRWCISVTS